MTTVNAEITEIRKDRREDFISNQNSQCGGLPLSSGQTFDSITKKFFRSRPDTPRHTPGGAPAAVKPSFSTYLPEFRVDRAASSDSRSFHLSRPGSTEESTPDCPARAFEDSCGGRWDGGPHCASG